MSLMNKSEDRAIMILTPTQIPQLIPDFQTWVIRATASCHFLDIIQVTVELCLTTPNQLGSILLLLLFFFVVVVGFCFLFETRSLCVTSLTIPELPW